jgi:outer membrane protein
MKKVILFIVALSIISFNAFAAETKIAYVDFKRAVSESDQGKMALSELEKMVDEKKGAIDAKGEEIRKIDEELAKQASVLTPESLKMKQDEREKLIRDYQRMVKDSEEDLQKKELEYIQKISRELKNLLQKLGEEEGYTAIFEVVEGGILYMPEELDITDKVIKRFNEASAADAEK